MPETLKTISASELKSALEGEHPPVLINALPRDAHEARHIPGSISVPVENAEQVEDIVPNRDEPIVVYCANADCDASPKLAHKLEERGYTNVADFEDGYAGWRQVGHPLVGTDV
jgi:rhodanese-related sulfurtransferase